MWSWWTVIFPIVFADALVYIYSNLNSRLHSLKWFYDAYMQRGACLTETKSSCKRGIISMVESLQNHVVENSAGRQTSIECLLIGSSNCRNLVIPEDDDLRIQVASHITSGLKIQDAVSKFHSVSNDELSELRTVILHMGSTDFPVASEKDFETHFMEYIENMTELSTRCSKAEILISSVLPRNENLSTKSTRNCRSVIY